VGLKTTIKDGSGKDLEAKVSKSGPLQEGSLHVNLSGVTPRVSVPVFFSPIFGGQIFAEPVLNSGSSALNVNGSVTPVVFRIEADPEFDIIINQLVWDGEDNSIKLTNFFSINSALTNGIEVSFKSDDVTSTLPLIKTTSNMLQFSSGAQDVYSEQGSVSVLSFRDLDPAIIIRKQGFHESGVNDFIQVTIQDNLTTVNSLRFTARGVKVESGTF
jgi:hypothetical protein